MSAMWVIKRVPDGWYVANMRKSKDGHSYTQRLQNAQAFRSEAAAESNRCPENEVVVSVEREVQ